MPPIANPSVSQNSQTTIRTRLFLVYVEKWQEKRKSSNKRVSLLKKLCQYLSLPNRLFFPVPPYQPITSTHYPRTTWKNSPNSQKKLPEKTDLYPTKLQSCRNYPQKKIRYFPLESLMLFSDRNQECHSFPHMYVLRICAPNPLVQI